MYGTAARDLLVALCADHLFSAWVYKTCGISLDCRVLAFFKGGDFIAEFVHLVTLFVHDGYGVLEVDEGFLESV